MRINKKEIDRLMERANMLNGSIINRDSFIKINNIVIKLYNLGFRAKDVRHKKNIYMCVEDFITLQLRLLEKTKNE